MFDSFATMPRILFRGFHSRHPLLLENLALRHQLTVLQRSVTRAKHESADRFLWILLLPCWSGWQRVLVIVQPRTVVAWHRLGFRLFDPPTPLRAGNRRPGLVTEWLQRRLIRTAAAASDR